MASNVRPLLRLPFERLLKKVSLLRSAYQGLLNKAYFRRFDKASINLPYHFSLMWLP